MTVAAAVSAALQKMQAARPFDSAQGRLCHYRITLVRARRPANQPSHKATASREAMAWLTTTLFWSKRIYDNFSKRRSLRVNCLAGNRSDGSTKSVQRDWLLGFFNDFFKARIAAQRIPERQ